MGIVYLARDLQHDRLAAVKVINLEQANALSYGQFSYEAQITARLSHPHIVSVYEVGNLDSSGDETMPYIAMEYVQGTSLDNLHNLTYPRIIDLGKQICEALGFAHSKGFIHRDLKPGNVLIEKHGFKFFAKLVDFGLAIPRGITDLPPGNGLAGTVFYMAPEVIAGQPADVASDLYAFGALLYEMVTGRVPFSDFLDDQAIQNQHLEEKVSPPSQSRADMPPALESIILRLLEKDPKQRYESASEVSQALNNVLSAILEKQTISYLPPLPYNSVFNKDQVAKCIRLLEENPLLTIKGSEENFILALGAEMMNEFTHGVCLVELVSIDEPARVLSAVSKILGVEEATERGLTVQLVEYLREKNLFLILNHCDKLRNACAQLASTILDTCPDVRILATCSSPLNVQGEMVYEVPSESYLSA